MDHGTSHAAEGDRRALVLVGVLQGMYFVVELIVGLWTGSVAIIADAFHSFSAVGGVLIALIALRLSQRPATPAHTFGWGRAEIIGGLFNGLLLIIMAAFVFWMGATRLMDPIELPTNPMLLVAAIAIVTELIAFWMLYERQKGNLNVRGAFWHIMQTFIGSLVIITSALVIRFTGFLQIDPILGMAFGLMLFWASWSIIGPALKILLQSTPEDLDLEAAINDLRSIEAVQDVHHIHAWTLAPGRNLFSGHIRVEDFKDDGERVLHEASNLLKRRYNVFFSTIQVEDERLASEAESSELDITAQNTRADAN